MANPEQLTIFLSGHEAWNDWRRRNPDLPVDLSHVNLSGRNLQLANLRSANLSQATFIDTDFMGVDLIGADLRSAILRQANLVGVDLTNANLVRADFGGANLSEANLTAANLSLADLRRVVMFETDLGKANLHHVVLSETIFGNANLGGAKGLDACRHSGPSVLDHRTLMRSGALPLQFLRGCGLPDNLIEYLPSLLTAEPIQFYSCFISYSTEDELFANRLHADLQNNGVRCWYAPHSIQGGKKLHEQIDEAIRQYDKLLLILSQASINSEWVRTEIAKARKRELRENRRMLFPLRLVDFNTLRDWECFDADSGKDSAREIREYFIPDFSHWKTDHHAYVNAFDRLLKDLKTEDQPKL